MQAPFPYLVARAVVRAVLAVYFRGIDVAGAKNVPAKGPVILAANHPQSVTDAMVLAAASPRAARFIAHSGLFENRVRGWLLRSCGVIPVYRAGEKSHDEQRAREERIHEEHIHEEHLRDDRVGEERALDKRLDDESISRRNVGRRTVNGRNVEMFAACAEALEKGGAIGVFPEGVSTEEPRVQKLKTGTARIALQAESQNGWRLGVSVVPVGLTFESRRRMRTRVLVAFGEPIPAERYREPHEEDAAAAARLLSADLESAISRLVVDIERPEFEALVREVDLIYKKELVAREGLRGKGREGFGGRGLEGGREGLRDRAREKLRERGDEGPGAKARDKLRENGGEKSRRAAGLGHEIDVEIPRVLDFLLERRPEVVRRVQKLLGEYTALLERARVRDDVLRDPKERTLGREVAQIAALGAAGFPLALYGALWSYVPYRFTGFVAHGVSKDETKIHYYQIVCGAVFFLLWYMPVVYLASRVTGPLETAIFAVSLPVTGLFAQGYVRWLARRGMRLRYLWLRMTHGRFVRDLERRRRVLIAEMDIALAEYMAARLAAGSGTAVQPKSGVQPGLAAQPERAGEERDG